MFRRRKKIAMLSAVLTYPEKALDQHLAKMRASLTARFAADLNDWDRFVGFFHLQTLAENQHWVRAGELCEEFFYISEGLVRIYYVDQDGNEVNEGFYEEGKMLGPISSFVHGSPCLYYIQAIEACTLVVANYPQFHAYAEDKPDILRFEITFLQSLFLSNAKRDAKRLTSRGEQRYRWFCREYAHLLERIPQYHIASFLGMTPVSLSRLRKNLSQTKS